MEAQKLVIKIPRNQNELIPFDLYKWNTGNYEVYRKNYGVLRVLCTDKIGKYPIVVSNNEGYVDTFTSDGLFLEHDTSPQLFLYKKTNEELPKNNFGNMYLDGVLNYPDQETANKMATTKRLALIHITYEWENYKDNE